MKKQSFVAAIGMAGAVAMHPAVMTGAAAQTAAAPPAEPTRIVIEAEEMQGVAQDKFGPGPGWQVGRWGYDLYQNMIFGGVWSSRQRNAMADAGNAKSEASSVITVPADGTYKVWAKYECPPNFNYAFGIRIQSTDGGGNLFDKTYGLINNEKHYSFNDKPMRGNLYWSWGMDHDAAEGYPVDLKKGTYRVTLYKAENPAPAGARSVDAIMLTTDQSAVSAPKFPRFPLLDELRRANHLFIRFRNQGNQPVKVGWNHYGHRPNDYYYAEYRDKVKFYDAAGNALPAPPNNKGNWPDPIAPGAASVWHDIGPTLNTESPSPFVVKAMKPDVQVADISSLTLWGPSLPVAVDIALEPNAKSILKSFELSPGEGELTFVVQPDLFRKEGVQSSKKLVDVYRDATKELNAEPRLGPFPKKIRIFSHTGRPSYGGAGEHNALGWDFEVNQAFRQALGVNTMTFGEPNADSKKLVDAMLKYHAPKGSLMPRTFLTQYTSGPKDAAATTASIIAAGLKNDFYYHSYGDEIGLPYPDVKDPVQVEKFRAYIKAQGETPQSLGLESWDQVKPLDTLSSAVAVQIGVLPKDTPVDASATRLKRLYWHSNIYSLNYGLDEFAAKTRQFETALGPQALTTANLGGMHPFYWMNQNSFIDGFKHKAMTLAWSEDYDFCQPEASRLVVDFEVSYLRKGASYHDTPMQFYCMPHWPGNTPTHVLQNAVTLWANNVKDLDWFNASPNGWVTENYVNYRGGMPMWKTLRKISGMAGLVENDLVPARPAKTPVAMILSRSSDLWEVEGKWQSAVQPGSIASNVSQEERKNLWYALRHAGYRVDFVTEDDVKDGLLKNYKVAYLSGENLDHNAVPNLKAWVQGGGVLYATAGAARKDEFDEPSTALDEVLGRGARTAYDRYRGPLRAKLELMWEKPKDQVRIGANTLDALCSVEKFTSAPGAEVLGRFTSDNSPALVKNKFGSGTAYYIGTLPGQTYVWRAMPIRPMGKGGDDSNMSHFEPINFDPVAGQTILRAAQENGIVPDTTAGHRDVVLGRLESPTSTVITAVNLAEQHDGGLKNLEIRIGNVTRAPRKVWSTFHKNGIPFKRTGSDLVLTMPTLQSADVIVVSYS